MDGQMNKTGAPQEEVSFMRRHRSGLLVTCTCVGVTLLAFYAARYWEQERICTDLDHEAGVRALVLEREIDHHETIQLLR